MKKFAFIIIAIIGIITYQQRNIMEYSKDILNQGEHVLVQGKVAANLSILGQSAYKLVNISDTSKVYYVISHRQAPAIGETLNISVQKQELVILNNDTLAVYMETGTNE